MAKSKSVFVCQSCGQSAPKWLGRCPGCNGWNTMAEEKLSKAREPVPGHIGSNVPPTGIADVASVGESRIKTGMEEFDRVLGGGMVPGGCVLVGGDPGIGKSTLLLQAMGKFSEKGGTVLYVSGEESMRQIKLRGERLGVTNGNLLVWPETSVERITGEIKEIRPSAIVIDSVQTLYCDELESSAGSVSQVRESSFRLIGLAKTLEIPLFLIGHVTKDGSIAGPKVLEHMVDTVLYFEGKSGHVYRMLRAVKNRYGSVMEMGVFEMKGDGLAEVTNPSGVFLAERPEGASGSCVTSCLEGTRTFLVEVQALVSPSVFGMPRRTVAGVDYNKVMLLAAVLEKKAGVTLSNHDIFVKVAGDLRIDEPSADMGIIASLTSNFFDKAVNQETVVFGEIGLAGEVRGVTQAEQRVREAAKLGFKRCVLPEGNAKGMKHGKVKLVGVKTVKEAIDAFFVQ
ncbi:MAG: DNA repair protein RadA [Thermodesulfobacteriota bacterium]